jgi:nicotinamide-nucleotide amidase
MSQPRSGPRDQAVPRYQAGSGDQAGSGEQAGGGPSAGSVGPADGGTLVVARELAEQVIGLLIARSETLAVAESLTGGMLAAALTAVPGASAVFRGGVVAYATDLKAALLEVPSDLLARHGAVHPDVAAAMAVGVRSRLKAGVGAATTGVAGPDPSDGQPVGTVYIAVSVGRDTAVRALALTGDRHRIRVETVGFVLRMLTEMLREDYA